MEAQLFAMFDSRRLAKDVREKNVVNDRVEMTPPAPSVGKRVSKQGTSNLIQQ
tara:strand:- start:80 stop:238 length:159 start_codon:yes stop_codon:yes gene_type:complete